MASTPPVIGGLVCSDDAALGRAVALLMHGAGLRVLGIVPMLGDGILEARRDAPRAIVVDAAVLGVAGIPVLSGFAKAVPGCTLVLISPFPALAEAALAAGAAAVVDPSDLRPLLHLFVSVRAAAHAGYSCTCCTAAASSTSAVFDARSSTVSRPESFKGLLRERRHSPLPEDPGTEPTGPSSTDTAD